jgi:aromatic-amino-acid transaminase
MKAMVSICSDPAQVARLDAERVTYFNLIKERASLFMQESSEVGLKILPYISGFFITIPVTDSKKICTVLEKDNIFLVPLKKGIRLAVCSVSKAKIKGLAAKIKAAVDEVGAKQ